MKIKTFSISFLLPLADSAQTIQLSAIAEEHHSKEHYIIRSIKVENQKPSSKDGEEKALCFMEIKPKDSDGKKIWVHCNSEEQTQISTLVGQAIEEALNR